MTLKDSYISATKELLQSGAAFESVAQGLHRTLTAHGHLQLKRAVLEGVLREYKSGNSEQPTLTVASAADAEKYADKIANLIQDDVRLHTQIDTTLIGGYVFEQNAIRHDKSYKRVLLTLYRRITS